MTGSAAASPAAGDSWAATLDAYRDGVRVLQRLGSKFVDWSLPTGHAGWSAVTLAGHLLCTARRHHRLLDAALAGQPVGGLPAGADLLALHEAEVASLGVTAGADRVVAFDAVATRYAERLAEVDPRLVVGSWRWGGPLDVATHAREAAAGWHLHAWDLADALGWDYRPARPADLLASGDEGGDPWDRLLRGSGRRPPPEPRPAGP